FGNSSGLENDLALPGLHARGFDADPVTADAHRGRGKKAIVIGHGVGGAARFNMQDRDLRFSEHGAGGIFDRALYGSTAGARLSEACRRDKRREQEWLQT